ncbi:ATP-binding cassette domain-containing protein [Paracoccus limosus]|uniref:ATP-binding cassette domain-containing protein n=1 Tax=Paracoccus limosus TaxID=913252 RepID=A0A844H5Y3_9RHOB|nr:ABC transporter ATP-binding protein [Paracoccus limosus]MTH33738.1 ATP-binding cassette domain-containing protein [Paracoccus limosus]
MTGSSALRLDRVRKDFGPVTAVQEMTLDIAPGQLVALLGPSGCGKTTTLRMVAGFETPSAGRIVIGDRDVTDLPPHRRNLGMVFQNYSLFPHRTVAENIAFGLRMAGRSRAEQRDAVARMLDLVQLGDRGDMYPRQLSGGQQQRIALARSLVLDPRVLLLDEPLGALDKALRESMQFEIRAMQQRLGITTLLVTHDQEEAMTMADQIAVMQSGRVLQIGAPAAVYNRPESRFVAEFLGTSNIFDGRVRPSGQEIEADGVTIRLPRAASPGAQVSVSVRPERIVIGEAAHALPNRMRARLADRVFRGTHETFRFEIGPAARQVHAHRQAGTGPAGVAGRPQEDCWIGWDTADSVIVTVNDR